MIQSDDVENLLHYLLSCCLSRRPVTWEEHPSSHNWHCRHIFLFMGSSVRIMVMEHLELLHMGEHSMAIQTR